MRIARLLTQVGLPKVVGATLLQLTRTPLLIQSAALCRSALRVLLAEITALNNHLPAAVMGAEKLPDKATIACSLLRRNLQRKCAESTGCTPAN